MKFVLLFLSCLLDIFFGQTGFGRGMGGQKRRGGQREKAGIIFLLMAFCFFCELGESISAYS